MACSPARGESGNGGGERRAWRRFRLLGAFHGERGRAARDRGEREREGRQGVLIPWRSFGGDVHLLAGIDGGQPSTELLAAREEDDWEKSWAGLR
jgi:hypothetical protein